MKAVLLSPDGVMIGNVPIPKINSKQVLIEVYSSSLNRSDFLETQGQSFGHLSGSQKIMGATCCGKIIELGDEVSGFSIGERVVAQGSGGWAEFCAADFRRVLPVPSPEMSYLQAGTFNSSVLTMHDAIVTHGLFKAGQTILIQGASSGVGLMGMQIAKFLGAKLVLASSRDKNKFPLLKNYKADICIDISRENWEQLVLDATEQKGVDLVVDQLSGKFGTLNLNVTKIGGRIINVGRLAGQTDNFDFNKHAERRITFIGTTGRTRSIAEHEAVSRSAKKDLWGALASGSLHMPIDSRFHYHDVTKALERMKQNAHSGRIMLEFKQTS